MGDRHGRMRFHRRHVPLLRYTAGNRSAYPRRCLHLWLPTPSRSIARRLDEIAGKNFSRTLVQKSEAEASRTPRGSAHMNNGHPERSEGPHIESWRIHEALRSANVE